MSRVSRDELIAAMRVITHILQAMPGGEWEIPSDVVLPSRSLPPDGSVLTTAGSPTADGSQIYGYGKGQLQPPRKRYVLSPKVKIERVDWGGIPRAGRRIAEDLVSHPQSTSHEIMKRLEIARPTFQNAMSKLRDRKVVVTVPARGTVDGAEQR